ncbi:hypothetical protein G4O51_10960 [Candidatus Bathyarchaeota archaeon A05DMB-2]|nr:hypothetical protein [Candidatus Bathyarchaeota archaeon A05DMB-2]
MGVGTFYYQLDMLSEFVVQEKQRRYYLNERGQMLHRILKDGVFLRLGFRCVCFGKDQLELPMGF